MYINDLWYKKYKKKAAAAHSKWAYNASHSPGGEGREGKYCRVHLMFTLQLASFVVRLAGVSSRHWGGCWIILVIVVVPMLASLFVSWLAGCWVWRWQRWVYTGVGCRHRRWSFGWLVFALLLARLLFVLGSGGAGVMLCWRSWLLLLSFIVGLAGVRTLVSPCSAWWGWECQCVRHTCCHCGSAGVGIVIVVIVIVVVLHLTGRCSRQC